MLTKDNKSLFINKKENIELHSECIIRINDLHDKLLLEKKIYDTLYDSYKRLEINYKDLQKVNEENVIIMIDMRQELEKLKDWKNSHNCNNINLEETKEYIELKNINEGYNNKIIKLEYEIKNIQLKSNIEDNFLFVQMKKQNESLNNEILNLKNKEDYNINIDEKIKLSLEEQKEELFNHFSVERDKIKNEHATLLESIKKEKDKVIEDLRLKINNKYNGNKNSKDDKNSLNYLYKGFSFFDESDTKWKVMAGSFTYKKFKILYDFNDAIEKDIDVNQSSYNEVIEYLNDKTVLNGSGKYKKLSPYYKNKLKRISEIYNIFGKKLININIKSSFIASLNKEQFELFINILKKEINIKYQNKNVGVDSQDNKKPCKNVNYNCIKYVTNRVYCQECIADGYYTDMSETDDNSSNVSGYETDD